VASPATSGCLRASPTILRQVTGPYAYVRHPGYAGAALLFVGTALSLGSWAALVPAGLSILLLILRTQWEAQTLQAELPGYKECAARVRAKWIPGVWVRLSP
jgi:protein-S-isoprenylcysteine O-methyltransferase Ste14